MPGLLPPMAGCEWHMTQLFPLKDDPSPRMVGLLVLRSGAPSTLTSCPKAAMVLNQKPAAPPPWRITWPAPSLPIASGGCRVFTIGVGSSATPLVLTGPENEADCAPTGLGPGSQDDPDGHAAAAAIVEVKRNAATAGHITNMDWLGCCFIRFSSTNSCERFRRKLRS